MARRPTIRDVAELAGVHPGTASRALDPRRESTALWLTEAANALWRRARTGDITIDEAAERFSELLNAPVASLAMEPYLDRALKLAMEIDHPVYDCVYLALALHHDTHLVTADRRFASVSGISLMTDRVRLLPS